MPIYNSELYVAEAINSLLGQSFGDFEIIVVDDGSTDRSLDIVLGFRDSRIRVLKNEKNRGIVYSRNRGLNEIKGRFYAPFDSDDVASPAKFEKQFEFLNQNPNFAMLGSWARMIDENGTPLKTNWKLKAPAKAIPSIMLFRNYFVHSTLLVRKNAIPKHQYLGGLDVVEDYRFCLDIALKNPIWNYPEFLLDYRVHQKSAMRSDVQRMKNQDTKIYTHIFNLLNIELSDEQAHCILTLKGNDRIRDLKVLDTIHSLLVLILEQNIKLRIFDHRQLQKTAANRWIKACSLAKHQPVKMVSKMISSPLTTNILKF
jgi:glycosyltransferase involved in cell wall biosynthesis